MARKRNFVKEAFFSLPNLIGLAVGGLATLTGFLIHENIGVLLLLPYVFGEGLFLALMGRSRWFKHRVRYRKGWGGGLIARKEREQYASMLSLEHADRYRALRKKYRAISDRAERDLEDEPLVEAAIQKLEGLSDTYLRFLLTLQRTTDFLKEVDRARLTAQLEEARHEAEAAEGQIRQMRERSATLIEKRLSQVDQAEENQRHIEEQLKMIEIGVDAIHDEVITMDRMTEVGTQIDLIMTNLSDAERTVTEMDSLVKARPIDDTMPEIFQEEGRKIRH